MTQAFRGVAYESATDSEATALNRVVLDMMFNADYENAYRVCREALRKDPKHIPVRTNYATVLKMLGREDEALEVYSGILRERPDHSVAINNLAYSYLRRGRYKDGWILYHQRLRANAASAIERAAPVNPLSGLPLYCQAPPKGDELKGKHVLIVPEQGIGDELMFMRFSTTLVAKSPASIWYAPSPKVRALFRRLVPQVINITDYTFADAPRDSNTIAVMAADLPMVLGHDGTWFPPSLRLAPDAIQPEVFSEPTLGVTWRAGTLDGTHRGRLYKSIEPELLGRALRDVPYKILVIQRGVQKDETKAFAAGLGRPFQSWTTPPRGASTELLRLAALLAGLTQYVGPSNANTHIRALLGLDQHVLVEVPGEWRWPITHPVTSPWFPRMKVYRKEIADEWEPALQRLTRALGGTR